MGSTAKSIVIGVSAFAVTCVLAYPWIEKLTEKPAPPPETIFVPVPQEPATAEELPDDTPDYAQMALSYDYLNAALIQKPDLDEMHDLWDRAYSHYQAKNTQKEQYEAVMLIYQAKQYWPDLTTRKCLQYLIDAIPDPSIRVSKTVRSGSESQTGDYKFDRTYDDAAVTFDVEVDFTNCRLVSEAIYQNLVYLAQLPAIQAAEAEQARREAEDAEIQANYDKQQQRRADRAEQYRANQAAASEAAAAREQRRAEWNEKQAREQYLRGQRF
ncbi:MAG: hypothetical protein K1Y02_24730 [Candidatus Hydrogenedentes bacterium]|nr:hypothetical protein [Candidatus Hydrogenedentota bacterium]